MTLNIDSPELHEFMAGYARGAQARRDAQARVNITPDVTSATVRTAGRFTASGPLVDAIRADAAPGRGHKGTSTRWVRAAAAIVQNGACWICTDPLGTDVQADRIINGRDLGRCDGRCAGDRCRCGYVPGNVAAAHAECNNARTQKGVSADALTRRPTAAAVMQYRGYVKAQEADARRKGLIGKR